MSESERLKEIERMLNVATAMLTAVLFKQGVSLLEIELLGKKARKDIPIK